MNLEPEQNRPLRWYRSLTQAKNRRQEGFFLIEGERAVKQLLTAAPLSAEEIILASSTLFPLLRKEAPCALRTVTRKQFSSFSQVKTPQGVAALVKIPEHTYSTQPLTSCSGNILLLEHVQDPGNLGTLIRTAAAFDFSGVIMSDKCADPFSPKTVQSAAGTLLSLEMRRTQHYLSYVHSFRKKKWDIISFALDGRPLGLHTTNRNKRLLCLGNEANGLSRTLTDLSSDIVAVPINRDKAESLNVALTGAIAMYVLTKD